MQNNHSNTLLLEPDRETITPFTVTVSLGNFKTPLYLYIYSMT